MPRTLAQLPSKRQFYNKLNDFVEEAYLDMTTSIKIPRAGQHIYRTKSGMPLFRMDKKKFVPPNSGRLLGSLPKPGRIHVRGFADKQAKAGKIVFLVKDGDLYDPIMQEHYWTKIAYNVRTDFGLINFHRRFWEGAAQQLRGKLMTYRDSYATYKPSWLGKFTEEQLREIEMEKDIKFMSLLQLAEEEGKI